MSRAGGLIYRAFAETVEKTVDRLLVQDLNLMLVSENYSASVSHSHRSDVIHYEITAPGYRAGGAPVAGFVVGALGSGTMALILTTVRWLDCDISARGGIIYQARGGSPKADELVSHVDFGDVVVSEDGAFSVEFTRPMVIG